MIINCWYFVLERTEGPFTQDPSLVCRAFRDATRECFSRPECPLSPCLLHCASLLPKVPEDSAHPLNFGSWVWVACRAQRIMITDWDSFAGIQGTIKKMVAFMDLLHDKNHMSQVSNKEYLETQRDAIHQAEDPDAWHSCYGCLVAQFHRVEVCLNEWKHDCVELPVDLHLSVSKIGWCTNMIKSGLFPNTQKCLVAQVKSMLWEFEKFQCQELQSVLNVELQVLDGLHLFASNAFVTRIANDIAKR